MNINVICPVNQTGYGVTGLQTLRYLVEVGHDVTWFPIGMTQLDPKFADIYQPLLARIHYREKNYDPEAPSYRMFHEFDSVMFPVGSGKTVTQVVFELDRIAPNSVHQLKQLSSVAVPTQWGAEVLNKCGVDNTTIVNHGVDTGVFYPDDKTRSGPFKFLCVGKWERRKSQEEVVQAFYEEFGPKEDVRLILMCHNPFLGDKEMEEIRARVYKQYAGPPRVTFQGWSPTVETVAFQMREADCGVFASKAEGWNLPLQEMLACGKPVVATNVTGHTEFLNDTNHINIHSPGMELAADGKFFHGEGQWHRVPVPAIRSAMREAYEQGRVVNEAGLKTAQAFSWHRTVKQIEEALLRTRD